MNNPYVQNLTDITAGRIGDQLSEQVMPAIRAQAIGRGQSGSSRHGIAEGLAAKAATQAIGDSTTRQLSDAYSQGLTQQARGMAFAPQSVAMGFGPSAAVTSVGDKYRDETTKSLQEDILRWQFAKEAPWEDLSKYQQFIQGGYGSQGQTTTDNDPSTLGSAIGGGLAGVGLADTLLSGGFGGMGAPSFAGLGSAGTLGLYGLGGALMGGLFG